MAFKYCFHKTLSHGGRNNTGRTTVRYRGAPARRCVRLPVISYFPPVSKSRYRIFSPFRSKVNPHVVASCVKVQAKLYQFHPFLARFTPRSYMVTGSSKTAFSMAPLYTVPRGTFVTNVQSSLFGKPIFGRAPGSMVQVLRRRGSYTTVKLPSGELRRIHAKRFSFFSSFGSFGYTRQVYTKAGERRRLGIRPHVRGCAMNPVDHPHGGRTGESRPSVSPWGILTKGQKTRTKPINRWVVIKSVQDLKKPS